MSDKFIPYEDIKIPHDFIVSIGIVLGLLLGRLGGVIDTIYLYAHDFTFFGIEMHHCYYGLFLFLISYFTFIIIPQSKNKKLSLLEGMGLGIMLDDIHLIMKLPYIPYESVNSIYMETWPSFILFLLFSIILAIILYKRVKILKT